MVESFHGGRVVLHAGDCLEVLAGMPENSVDAIDTDPPYHFQTIVDRFGKPGAAAAGEGTDGVFRRASSGFMGKDWDGGDIAFRAETWAAAMRVLKPGGHLAAFSAPKCVHRMAFAIELAGFEIRDRIVFAHDDAPAVEAFLESLSAAQADALFRLLDRHSGPGELFWAFGTGFPKSHDVSKAIDKMLGGKREKVATAAAVKRMIPAADQNRAGWEKNDGREYVPGVEIPATPQAAQWAGWGTAFKPAYEPIVIARKPLSERSVAAQVLATGTGAINVDAGRVGEDGGTRAVGKGRDSAGVYGNGLNGTPSVRIDAGRFPANLAHDGSAAVTAMFPETAPSPKGMITQGGDHFSIGSGARTRGTHFMGHGDSGSAARFFYSAKAGATDRVGAKHPTVKPVDLMVWLVRMLCPPGGTVLDMFAGTGTTGEAAWRAGMNAVLIEREAEYRADIAARMEIMTHGETFRTHAIAARKAKPAQAPGLFDEPCPENRKFPAEAGE